MARNKKPTAATKAPASGPDDSGEIALVEVAETMDARSYLIKLATTGECQSMSRILRAVSHKTGLAYHTLHRHVAYGAPVRMQTAIKLEAWSGGRISAAKTMGMGR